jgi:hypothetical protein
MTHSNPLIAKWEEIYGHKEKPKPDYYKGEKSYAEELEELRDTSTIPITELTSTIPTKKLTSYDPHSGEDSFLQIAEKIKNKDARVTSITLNSDSVGVFTTGLTTITFEVQVYT